MAYAPQTPFNVPLKILKPQYVNSNGVNKKVYPAPDTVSDNLTFFGSFRTFGGTEKEVDGVYSVEKTATVETWYRPDIESDCCVYVMQTGQTYEILGDPENIEMRNQFLKFRVRLVKGGA